MRKSDKALWYCVKWLRFCLDIGWPTSNLDALRDIFWKYHDPQTGELLP